MADDQEVVIVDDKGTEHVFPSGFNPKLAAAIVRNGGSSALPTKPVSSEDFTKPTMLDSAIQTAKDVGIGAVKGLGSTVAGLGEMAVNAGMIPGQAPAAFNPAFRHPVFQKTDQATTATNTPQRIGKVGEQVAELALPVAAAAKAVPSTTRAGLALQDVMSAAKDVPLNVEGPGQVALRIQQLADRGGTMPRMARQLLQRATDPGQTPLTYGEGRDFYSNISRLSSNEFQKLTPVIQREVGNLKTALGGSLQDAAGSVGQGEQYANAMKEYAQAMKLKNFATTAAKAAVPASLAAGGAYYAGSRLKALVAALSGG